MGRIISIDYGRKRSGLAWTDPLKLIASGMGCFPTGELKMRLETLVREEDIETIVLGYPTRPDGSDSHITEDVRMFEKSLNKWFPALKVELWDERFSSKRAFAAMLAGGVKKKKRGNKQLINEVSATIILQEFLDQLA